MMDIKEDLLLWFIHFLIESRKGVVKHNEQIAEELQKSIIRNFKKRTVYSEFKDNIWGADLTDMQLVVHNRATCCSDTRQKQSPISICPF